jgi:hypothetical protein
MKFKKMLYIVKALGLTQACAFVSAAVGHHLMKPYGLGQNRGQALKNSPEPVGIFDTLVDENEHAYANVYINSLGYRKRFFQ